jgi:HupE / UreJ protein
MSPCAIGVSLSLIKRASLSRRLSSGVLQALCRVWLVAALLAWAPLAPAHEMSIAEMELREAAPGEFIWQWTASKRAASQDLAPQWPAACAAQGQLLQCGPNGLSGTLSVQGVGKSYSAVMVKVVWRDGQSRVYTLTSAQPQVQLYGSANDTRGVGEIAWAYGVLGLQHILSGADHLLFVVGLLLVVGFKRPLVLTISAFTLAHSLTLALAALGWLSLRPAPVEAVIALSIMLVAAEALHQRPTATRRWPALVALVFGLVHGLGFAGALKEIGLPENHLTWALLSFNVGVEAGQLLVLAAVGLLGLALRRAPWGAALLARLQRPVVYAMGGIAAYWTVARLAVLAA